jgi:hypothetical protein
MKNSLLFTLLLSLFLVPSCDKTQKKEKAPEKVIAAFTKQFPNAKEVEWSKENDEEWEAEFELNETDYSANYGLNGEWKSTEYEISETDVPAEIRTILDENFTDFEIEDIEVVETASGKAYEFAIEQGADEFEVLIDAQGKLTKKTVEEDENDED